MALLAPVETGCQPGVPDFAGTSKHYKSLMEVSRNTFSKMKICSDWMNTKSRSKRNDLTH